jgi:hypothetical protein
VRFLWGAVCKRAIVEAGSQKLSLIDIPEKLLLPAPAPPFPHPEGTVGLKFGLTYVAVFWRGEEEEATSVEVRLFWRSPDGERALLGGHEGRGPKEKNQSVRFLLEVNQVEYRGLGVYELQFEYRSSDKKKWQHVASYPLLVGTIPEFETTSHERPSEHFPSAPPAPS